MFYVLASWLASVVQSNTWCACLHSGSFKSEWVKPRFDLISMKIQIVGGKVKKILSFFLFIFKFFTQNWVSLILTIFWYLVLLFRNQIKHVENVCFHWYLICKTRYSKMVKNKDMQFLMDNLKMNRKRTKIFLTLLPYLRCNSINSIKWQTGTAKNG